MGAVLGTFTLVLGSWFYLLLILFFDAMIFMRSQSIAVTAVASVAVAGFLYAFLPTEAVAAISLTLTVFFAVALIRFFTGGRD